LAIAARPVGVDERAELMEVGLADVDAVGHFNLLETAHRERMSVGGGLPARASNGVDVARVRRSVDVGAPRLATEPTSRRDRQPRPRRAGAPVSGHFLSRVAGVTPSTGPAPPYFAPRKHERISRRGQRAHASTRSIFG